VGSKKYNSKFLLVIRKTVKDNKFLLIFPYRAFIIFKQGKMNTIFKYNFNGMEGEGHNNIDS
jgi:hypothetical protein